MNKRSDESWEDYLYRVHKQYGRYAQFRGFEPFQELFAKGIITPCITAIRLMYTGLIDIVFQVNLEGRLVDIKENDIFDSNCESFDPFEILSKRIGEKEWWELEGFKPYGYDERNKNR